MAEAPAASSSRGSISNAIRVQQTLTLKKQELDNVKDDISKLNTKKRVIEKDIKDLQQELEFLYQGDPSNQFDGVYPWTLEMMTKLKSVFKINAFRSHQESAINATMNKLDCILIMPTGGGKSLCFQLPAILSDGVTLVISPLLALMEDQLQGLKSLNIPAGLLNAQTHKSESKRIFEEMIHPDASLKLLYVTPERLAKSKRFMSQLEKMFKLNRLARIVIDECHCCSSWGHDFRPDYKFLGILRRQFPGTPIIGLTATATTKVTFDIQKMLNIEGCLVFKDSFFRPNLKYEVYDSSSSDDRANEVAELIKSRFPKQSGIIYCLTISEVEKVTAKLQSLKIKCDRYHAQLDADVRIDIQNKWYKNYLQVIVATVAFGMGINKLDVRFVIHYSVSKSLENFYQESGRAGRDGKTGYCILFYQLNDICRATAMVMAEKNGIRNVYNLLAYCLDRQTCRKALIARHFGDDWEGDPCQGTCDNCEAKKKMEGVASRLQFKTINAAPILVDILKLLQNADSLEVRVTVLRLFNVWFRKGEKKIRLDEVKVPTLSRTECEWIVGRLLLDQFIEEEYHYTPYATNSHIVSGSRKLTEGTELKYELPTFHTHLTCQPALPVKGRKSSTVTEEASRSLPNKRKSNLSAAVIPDYSDYDESPSHSYHSHNSSVNDLDASRSSASSQKDSTRKGHNTSKEKEETGVSVLKKQKMNFKKKDEDDDIVILD